MCAKISAKTIGDKGELKGRTYLLENGYTIIACNWRNTQGEIDIIASKDDILVFFEVKTLKNGSAETLEFVLGKIKQKKIVKTAKCFLEKNRQYIQGYIRFDVLVIDMPGVSPVYHIEDAFSECK